MQKCVSWKICGLSRNKRACAQVNRAATVEAAALRRELQQLGVIATCWTKLDAVRTTLRGARVTDPIPEA